MLGMQVQEWMEGQGTRAQALTYPQLIAKAKDGGNWAKALQLWEEAQAQRVRFLVLVCQCDTFLVLVCQSDTFGACLSV